ncbi:sialidase family protein [Streptomyces specialis]|uniref:sialidase family protein n=1 Tax=Streptomyces specialis TaxID=498367 RepID=UPI001F2CC435|nr:sialidase family protein [Streptomyces specialis]
MTDSGPGSSRAACVSSVPFAAGEGGYDTYRIPAAVTTPDGTLLAFAEGRVGGAGDSGHIDVVVRRSLDGGCTWEPLTVVAAGAGDTRGNPAPVVDPASGRVVLLTSFNGGGVTEADIMRGATAPEDGRRVFTQTSDDDGRTFTAPREITADVKLPDWRWYATGPGHGVALTAGEHAGRLVIPANHSAAPPAGSDDTGEEPRYYGAHALLSDDGGETWRIGYVDGSYDGTINANESSVAELPDGRLYFSARDQNGAGPGNRAGAYSADGGETLEGGGYAAQGDLDAVPVVQGSVVRPDGGPLLFTGPSDPDARGALTVWRSDDGGGTFTEVLTLSSDSAAYSELVVLADGTTGVLFETGTAGPYERIEFRRIDI